MIIDRKDRYHVMLEPPEMIFCAGIGHLRQTQVEATQAGKVYLANSTTALTPLSNHIFGARCEYLTSRVTNLAWNIISGSRDIDVGNFIEVRGRRIDGIGPPDLGIRDKDAGKLHCAYVLVNGRTNDDKFKLIGWMIGHDAWEIGKPFDEHLRYVPRDKLRPMDELFEVYKLRRDWHGHIIDQSDVFPPDRERNGYADRTADAKV